MIILRQRKFSEAGKRKQAERALKKNNKYNWLSRIADDHPEVTSPDPNWWGYEISDERIDGKNKLIRKAKELEKTDSRAAKKLLKKANKIDFSFYYKMSPELYRAGNTARLRDIARQVDFIEANKLAGKILKK